MKALINNKNKLVIISESKEEDNLLSRWHDDNWNRDFFYSAVEFRKSGSIIEPEIDESKVIHREPEMIKENKSRPDSPKPPISRVMNYGLLNSSGFCPICHSTAIRRPWLFGKRYCINKECKYHKKPISKQ